MRGKYSKKPAVEIHHKREQKRRLVGKIRTIHFPRNPGFSVDIHLLGIHALKEPRFSSVPSKRFTVGVSLRPIPQGLKAVRMRQVCGAAGSRALSNRDDREF
jgi:hypothetical protein